MFVNKEGTMNLPKKKRNDVKIKFNPDTDEREEQRALDMLDIDVKNKERKQFRNMVRRTEKETDKVLGFDVKNILFDD